MDKINFNISELDENELAELVAYHNRCYWELGEPEIDDSCYDELTRALAVFNPRHPLLTAVYAPGVATLGKVRHPSPMLSLDKAYSLEEVMAWARKYARSNDELLLVEPKYDGISARYDGKVLSTRGDGVEGEDISDKLPLLELEAPGYRGVLDRPARGEIIIRKDDFANIYPNIRKKGGGTYKNSRNAVAGIMGLRDAAPMIQQGARLTLADYDLISRKVTLAELPSQWETLVLEMEALPYPLDGIVVKLADGDYAAGLGNTAHHPRGALAFKFSNIRRESRLLDVEWSFGKKNLTPVALISPVEIGGTTIKRASLHNVQNVIDLDLHIGDTVTVERAGDVIPHIVSAVPGADRKPCIITHCPNTECGAELVRVGPELCCPNPGCSETMLRRLAAAVKSIGIENLGEPTIRRMMNTCHVRTLHDIFRLTKADILKLEGFAGKSADNLLKEIASCRTVADYQLLASLNIPHVGINMAKVIFAAHTWDEVRKMSCEDFAGIDGVGPERAAALRRELDEQSAFLDELLQAVQVTDSAGGAAVPTVCFTGKMPEKRSYYEALAVQHGMEPVNQVTEKLSMLVTAGSRENSSKTVKALKSGIPVVPLDEWLASLELPAAADEKKTAVHPEPENDGESQLTFGF